MLTNFIIYYGVSLSLIRPLHSISIPYKIAVVKGAFRSYFSAVPEEQGLF